MYDRNASKPYLLPGTAPFASGAGFLLVSVAPREIISCNSSGEHPG
jgi:hypothetical protein